MTNNDSKTAAKVARPVVMTELEPSLGAPTPGLREPRPPNVARDLAGALRGLKVRLTVSLGSAELSVGEILDAKAQQVIPLDRTVNQAVDVLLEGQVVARGTLVAVDDRFAIRVTELPVNLDLPTAVRLNGP